MKIVINTCDGGFSVSEAVYNELGIEHYGYGYISHNELDIPYDEDIRTNKNLIAAIESVGLEYAGGQCAQLSIVEIPDDVEYTIEDYDGVESIHEVHRVWY